MKKTLLVYLLISVSFSVFGQTKIVAFENMENEWGYMTPSGDVIIEPIYENAHDFSEDGIALVYYIQKRKWLFIDKNNNPMVMPFDKFEPKSFAGFGQQGFEDGITHIIVNKKACIVNSKGEVIHKPIYNSISSFVDGYANAIIDKSHYLLQSDGSSTEIKAKVTHLDRIVNGFAPYRDENKKFGFINTNGDVIIKAKYKKVGYFYNDLAWARTDDGKIGFIDVSGNWVFNPEYDAVSDFDNDDQISRIRIGEEWMYLKKTGETFKIPKADRLGLFHEGLAYAKVGDKFGFVNSDGQWVVQPIYDAVNDYERGQAEVKSGGLWGTIDHTGKLILDLKYKRFGESGEGLIPVLDGSLWGFVDLTGKTIIEPQFTAIRAFKNGYAAARGELSTWGLIDKTGKWVIEATYHRIKDVIAIQ